jgi:hypothetical protein
VSSTTVRFVIAIVLIAHGLGHGLGILAATGLKLSRGHSPDSWLLSGLIGHDPARLLGAALWLASLVAFVAAGLALAGWGLPARHWPTLAVVAAVLSLVTLAAFWLGLPFLFPNKVGVILVDVSVLVSVLWLEWPERLAAPDLF